MPKDKRSVCEILSGVVKNYPSEFSTDKQVLFCRLCEQTVSFQRKSQIDQHRKTAKHVNALQNRRSASQQLVTESFCNTATSTEFNKDLSKALLAGNFRLFLIYKKEVIYTFFYS